MAKPQSVSSALAQLGSPDRNTRLQAVAQLRLLGRHGNARAVDALGEALSDPDCQVRAAAVLGLGHLREGHALLASCLHSDASSHVRFLCAGMLCYPEYPVAVDAFLHALRDEEDKVAEAACSQLGYRGIQEAVPPIRVLLEHQSWRVRWSACEALYRLGVVDQPLAHALRALADDAERLTHDEWVNHCRQSDQKETREMGQGNWTTGELLDLVMQVLTNQQQPDGREGEGSGLP